MESKEFNKKVVDCYNSSIVITDGVYPIDIDSAEVLEAGYSIINGITRKVFIGSDYIGRNEVKTIFYLDKYGKVQVIQGFHLQEFNKSKIATPKSVKDFTFYVGFDGSEEEFSTLQILRGEEKDLVVEDHLCVSFGEELFILDLDSYKEESTIQVISPKDEVDTVAGCIRLTRYFIFTDIDNQEELSNRMREIKWN